MVPIRLPLHETVVSYVKAVAYVTGPRTVSGPAHRAAGIQVGVPAPPPIERAAPAVNKLVVTAAAPEGAIATVELKPPPFTAPVDTAPVTVVRVKVVADVNVVDARVIAAVLRDNTQNRAIKVSGLDIEAVNLANQLTRCSQCKGQTR